MRSPIALIGVVNIGVRIDMQDGQLGMALTHRTHDRMRDGMIAAETNQSIARLDCASDLSLDDIPRISHTVELDIAVVNESAWGTNIDPRFAPAAIAVGK